MIDVSRNDHIDVGHIQVKLSRSSIPSFISVIESFDATVALSLCIFLDEPTFQQLEVNCLSLVHV